MPCNALLGALHNVPGRAGCGLVLPIPTPRTHLLALRPFAPWQVADVAIVHTHGPKPDMSLCMMDYLRRTVGSVRGWNPDEVMLHKDELVQLCNIQVGRQQPEFV